MPSNSLLAQYLEARSDSYRPGVIDILSLWHRCSVVEAYVGGSNSQHVRSTGPSSFASHHDRHLPFALYQLRSFIARYLLGGQHEYKYCSEVDINT